MIYNKVVNNTSPPKEPHEHQYTIPVEWKYEENGMRGDYRQRLGKRVTKLRCKCGEEIER